jgi:putative ABC transport system permease protein
MIYVAFRDLIWRRRRYMISLFGCSLVLGLSLVQTGLSDSFPHELELSIRHLNAQSFVVPPGSSGPFTGPNPVPRTELPAGATPLAYLIESANPTNAVEVGMYGLSIGSPAEPKVVSGRQLRGAGDALVDDRSTFKTGSHIVLGKRTFTVVGRIADFSINAGMPGVVVPLASMQQAVLHGLDVITGGIVTAHSPRPGAMPAGWRLISADTARDDTLRLLANATKSIDLVKGLLWIVAALVVGSVVFLSTIERTTEIAVCKAIGVSTGGLAASLAVQAIVISLLSSIVGVLIALAVAPVFPLHVYLTVGAAALLPAIATLVGLAASVFGLRRAVRIDPALAFGGAGA